MFPQIRIGRFHHGRAAGSQNQLYLLRSHQLLTARHGRNAETGHAARRGPGAFRRLCHDLSRPAGTVHRFGMGGKQNGIARFQSDHGLVASLAVGNQVGSAYAERIAVVSITKDATDEYNGQVFINGGTLNLTVAADDVKGLKSESDMTIQGGTIHADVTGNGCKGFSVGGNLLIGQAEGATTAITMNVAGTTYHKGEIDESKCRGIKVKGNYTLAGGSIKMNVTGKKALYADVKANEKVFFGVGYENRKSDGWGNYYQTKAASKGSGTIVPDNKPPQLSNGTYIVATRGDRKLFFAKRLVLCFKKCRR